MYSLKRRWTVSFLALSMFSGCATSHRLPAGSDAAEVAEFMHRGMIGDVVSVSTDHRKVEGQIRVVDHGRGLFVVAFDRSDFDGPDSLVIQFGEVEEITVTDRSRSDHAVVGGMLVLGFFVVFLARGFSGGPTTS